MLAGRGGKFPARCLSRREQALPSVGLTMPAQFSVTGSPVTASGTIAVGWANAAAGSWFGNPTGGSAVPTFQATPFPASLVPKLPASQIVSGVIAPARLPVALGVGVSSAPGVVPDPGASGGATDYLGRDMLYHALPAIGPTYRPTIPSPVLTRTGPDLVVAGNSLYAVISPLAEASLFYTVGATVGTYAELPSGFISVPSGQHIWAYGSKAGYNNSAIATATAP